MSLISKTYKQQLRVRITSTFPVLRPFSYLRPFLYFDHFHNFDLFCTSTIFITSTFSVLRPFSYLRPFLYFDRYTSTSLLRHLYFDLCTSTFCQIWTSYWSRSTGRSTILVEVKFWSK